MEHRHHIDSFKKNEIEIYVKRTSNCPGGMSLTTFPILSEEWVGESLLLPFGNAEEEGEEEGEGMAYYQVTGWTDNLFDNPYPHIVRGCPTSVHVFKTLWGMQEGWLVYGGNSGLRVGGKDGWGMAVIWIENLEELPQEVQRVVG